MTYDQFDQNLFVIFEGGKFIKYILKIRRSSGLINL